MANPLTHEQIREAVACRRCGAPRRARCRALRGPFGPPWVTEHTARVHDAYRLLVTLPSVLDRVQHLPHLNDSRIDGAAIRFEVDFTHDPETQEPHDAVWDIRCEIVESLSSLGLAVHIDSDHDTVWGRITV